jgi:hypothetical protein
MFVIQSDSSKCPSTRRQRSAHEQKSISRIPKNYNSVLHLLHSTNLGKTAPATVVSGYPTLCPLSLCTRSLCPLVTLSPGHFVPGHFVPGHFVPRSLCPLVTLSPVTLSPVTLSPGPFVLRSFCPRSLCPLYSIF